MTDIVAKPIPDNELNNDISDEAKEYIGKLPTYEDLPPLYVEIPEFECAYRLPIHPIKAQWEYLTEWMKHFCLRTPSFVSPELFRSLPGVNEVSLVKPIFMTAMDCDVYGMLWKASVGTEARNVHPFWAGDYFSFKPTIAGAVTAFFMATSFPNLRSFSFERNPLTNRWERQEYGEPFSEDIPIPFGMRLEVVDSDRYVVSCLSDSMGDLWDIHVEVKKGKIVYPTKKASDDLFGASHRKNHWLVQSRDEWIV